MKNTNQVREFIVKNFLFGEGDSLDNDQSFLDTGIVDSTGMLELILFLEKTFNVKIEPEEMVRENLDSVNRVSQFLEKKLTPVTAG